MIIAAAATLAACSQNEELPQDGEHVAVRFATTASAVQTRTMINGSGETVWAQDDFVGIFMKSGSSVASGKYKLSNLSTGELSPDDASQTLYYPQSGDVDFIAYYPWRSGQTSSNAYPVNLSDQSDPAKIDLLRSRNATGKNKNSSNVNLEFEHLLAKLKMKIVPAFGLSGLTAVEVQNVAITADFYPSSGVVARTNSGQSITPRNTSAGGDTLREVILIPEQYNDYLHGQVKFTVDGNSYYWDISGISFQPGKLYSYEITVNVPIGITVSEPTITTWTGKDAAAVNGGIIEVVKIPAGTFTMGSPTSETNRVADETQHKVTLTQDFYMSKYEVTKEQYCLFLNAAGIGRNRQGNVNGYGTQALFNTNGDWTPKWDGAKWVVEGTPNTAMGNVTWYGALAFAQWAGGNLPTEAQWEYACRAGTATSYSYGAAANGDYMWYSLNSGGAVHAVGTKQPNPWGLYDMHGNMMEWCLDWYSILYGNSNADATDPTGPSTGSACMLRGGSWGQNIEYCRSASRFSDNPNIVSTVVGFRVVFLP